jgi:nucleoside-diphosphate-sugar epimerase
MSDGASLRDQRIVVTGASGLMGFAIARALAPDNDVTACARFSDAKDAATLEAAGARVVRFDLASHDLSPLPDTADVVFHFGTMTAFPTTAEERDWQFEVNTQSTGRLAMRYRECRAFVYASASIYKFQGERMLTEDDVFGVMPGIENYCASKIAAEQLLRFLSVEYGIPSVILRINSAYGPRGGSIAGRVDRVRAGEPVLIYAGVENRYSPIFETDFVEKSIASASIVAVPPEVVNLAGSETCSIEQYCAIAGELCGVEPILVESADAIPPLWTDPSKMERLLGKTSVSPREGIRRVLEADPDVRVGRWAVWKEPSEPVD